MSETIGAFTVDTADGVLIPARGVFIAPNPTPPPDYLSDATRAVPVPSTITTVAKKDTVALALTEAKAYYAAIGTVVTFRGVSCFVQDVQVTDHQASKVNGSDGRVNAVWTLYADPAWVPTP